MRFLPSVAVSLGMLVSTSSASSMSGLDRLRQQVGIKDYSSILPTVEAATTSSPSTAAPTTSAYAVSGQAAASCTSLPSYTQSLVLDSSSNIITAQFQPNYAAGSANLTYVDLHITKNCQGTPGPSSGVCPTKFIQAPEYDADYAINLHDAVDGSNNAQGASLSSSGAFLFENIDASKLQLAANDTLCYDFTYTFGLEQCDTGSCSPAAPTTAAPTTAAPTTQAATTAAPTTTQAATTAAPTTQAATTAAPTTAATAAPTTAAPTTAATAAPTTAATAAPTTAAPTTAATAAPTTAATAAPTTAAPTTAATAAPTTAATAAPTTAAPTEAIIVTAPAYRCSSLSYTQSVSTSGNVVTATFTPAAGGPSPDWVDFHISKDCPGSPTTSNGVCATPWYQPPFDNAYALNLHNSGIGQYSMQGATFANGVFTFNFDFTSAGLSAADNLCYDFTYAFGAEGCDTGVCSIAGSSSSTAQPTQAGFEVTNPPTAAAATSGPTAIAATSAPTPEGSGFQVGTATPVQSTSGGLNITGSDVAQNCTDLQRLANIRALNYALTLENLESTFYTQMQAKFSRQDFIDAQLPANAYDLFNLIAAHEQAHVSTISGAVAALGGSPATVCQYNFAGVTSVASYVATAKVLENTGVSAYDGAINAIGDASLRTVAATIATVEARHAAYLNTLSSVEPFPNAFDVALSPSAVLGAASSFFLSCPYSLELPSKFCGCGSC